MFVRPKTRLWLFCYNLAPLPFSDLLGGLDQISQRVRGRALPLRAVNVGCGAALLALLSLVFAMDLLRAL